MGLGWATHYAEWLKQGNEITIEAPHGNSMRPLISPKDRVTLVPITGELKIGDIVLVRVRGRAYLHLIKAIKGKTYLIGNNRGGTNGWVGPNSIYGVVTKIEEA